MTKKNIIYPLYLLMAFFVLMLVACSNESDIEGNNGNGEMVTVKAAISVRGNASTRSTYEDAANDHELINDWIILLCQDGKVKKILKREEYKIGSYQVEKEAFEFMIPAGTYNVYSFANISMNKLNAALGVTLTEGVTLPASMSNVVINLNTVFFENGIAVGGLWYTYLPMSGSKTVTFTSSGLQNEFEVVRMYGKIEFTYRNASSKSITVKSVKMNPVNTGNIPLLPDYSTLAYNEEKNPVLLEGVGTEQVTFDYTSVWGSTLSANSYTTNSFVHGFYLRESLASSHPTKHFVFNLNILRDGNEEDLQFALDDNFTGINRNDYVKVPIKFTDYTVGLDVNFYPPIGGYPAVISEEKGDEFYYTFATQGEFEIVPSILNAVSGAKMYYPNWDFDATSGAAISVDDPNSIFTIVPTINTSTGEIVGKLGTSQGTACITLNVKVLVGSGVYQMYQRRIYIIRKNA